VRGPRARIARRWGRGHASRSHVLRRLGGGLRPSGDAKRFGIAGTGSSATDDAYDAWPHTIRWADSSSAGYGPEGGSGPNQLAYLRVTGQECLYNVWSRLGVPHLEHLLSQLRFVK